MKKNQTRRSVVIILLLFIGITVVGLAVAAVYAGRFMSQETSSFLSQMAAVTAESYAQESGLLEDHSIFEQGVLVTTVAPSSPAHQAGIRRGTIILSVDGQEVSTLAHIVDLLAVKGSGATVSMTVLNGPKSEEIKVKLAEEQPLLGVQIAEANQESRFGHFLRGFDLSDIPEEFKYDPDNIPLSPEGFGFGQGTRLSGVLIAEVVEGGAAVAAGLKVGDAIEAINGNNIATVEQLAEQLGDFNPGDTIVLSIVRDGENKNITVTLGEHPEVAGRGFLGIQPAPLRDSGSMGDRDSFDPLGIPFHGALPFSGAVVMAVEGNSPAALADIQSGDIIEGIDGNTVTTVDDLIQIIGNKNPGDTISLSLLREGRQLDVEAILAAHPEDADRAYLGVELGPIFNVDIDKFGDGAGMLPKEFFFGLPPDFDPAELFHFPDDFEDLLPNFKHGGDIPKLQEQDA